jgi:hypothetical protein
MKLLSLVAGIVAALALVAAVDQQRVFAGDPPKADAGCRTPADDAEIAKLTAELRRLEDEKANLERAKEQDTKKFNDSYDSLGVTNKQTIAAKNVLDADYAKILANNAEQSKVRDRLNALKSLKPCPGDETKATAPTAPTSPPPAPSPNPPSGNGYTWRADAPPCRTPADDAEIEKLTEELKRLEADGARLLRVFTDDEKPWRAYFNSFGAKDRRTIAADKILHADNDKIVANGAEQSEVRHRLDALMSLKPCPDDETKTTAPAAPTSPPPGPSPNPPGGNGTAPKADAAPCRTPADDAEIEKLTAELKRLEDDGARLLRIFTEDAKRESAYANKFGATDPRTIAADNLLHADNDKIVANGAKQTKVRDRLNALRSLKPCPGDETKTTAPAAPTSPPPASSSKLPRFTLPPPAAGGATPIPPSTPPPIEEAPPKPKPKEHSSRPSREHDPHHRENDSFAANAIPGHRPAGLRFEMRRYSREYAHAMRVLRGFPDNRCVDARDVADRDESVASAESLARTLDDFARRVEHSEPRVDRALRQRQEALDMSDHLLDKTKEVRDQRVCPPPPRDEPTDTGAPPPSNKGDTLENILGHTSIGIGVGRRRGHGDHRDHEHSDHPPTTDAPTAPNETPPPTHD